MSCKHLDEILEQMSKMNIVVSPDFHAKCGRCDGEINSNVYDEYRDRPAITYVDAGFSVHEKCPKCKEGWLQGYREDGMSGSEKCTNPKCDYDVSYP